MERLRRFLAAAALLIITPCFTELLSGSTPAALFFRPATFIPLVLLYGLPTLLIRDLWVRWNPGFAGLFCLGLAYGIYNEGVVSQTLRLSEHVPVDAFDGYHFLGINWPWASFILPWHALHATIFPIALVSWLFPSEKNRHWLPPIVFYALLTFVLLFGVAISLTNHTLPSSPSLLGCFLAAIGLLAWLARSLKTGTGFLANQPGFRPLAAVAGFFFYPFLLITLAILGKLRTPAPLVCVTSGLILYGAYRLLARARWLSSPGFLLFVFGDYLAAALFTMIATPRRGSLFDCAAECTLAGASCLGIIWIGLSNRETLRIQNDSIKG